MPRVLDLGCGKGAVSIKIAKQLNYPCYGIDAIPEFISFAKEKAKEYGVGNLCKFEVADVRQKVQTIGKYEIIILGSVGQVFGTYYETLRILTNNLTKDGILIIDDGYLEEKSSFTHDQVFFKKEITKQIAEAGMELIDEIISDEASGAAEIYDQEYENLSTKIINKKNTGT